MSIENTKNDQFPNNLNKDVKEDTISKTVHTSGSLSKSLSFSGNILWLFFGGGLSFFLLWFFQSIISFLSVIGAPVGVACHRIAIYSLRPFGYEVIDKSAFCKTPDPFTILACFLWLPFGLVMAILHCLAGIILIGTVIGIPFGLVHLRLARIVFMPYFVEILKTDTAKTLKNLNSKFGKNGLNYQ